MIEQDGFKMQKSLQQLENKIVRFMKSTNDDSEIIFISCEEYDHCFSINSSTREQFNLEIPRSIEPNIIQIFDMDLVGIIEDQKL